MTKVGIWKAAIWDRPMNGIRWCVQRKNPAVYGGEEVHVGTDDRLLTYASRTEAARVAARANRGEPRR